VCELLGGDGYLTKPEELIKAAGFCGDAGYGGV
jgi:hypothetical protein